MKMKKLPGRITKKQARKMWDNDEKFVIVPCRCRPYDPIKTDEFYGYSVSMYGITVVPGTVKLMYDTFDEYVNAFTFYNCCAEVGNYPAFYVCNSDSILN